LGVFVQGRHIGVVDETRHCVGDLVRALVNHRPIT
jgi:hypothetical protein